MFEKSTEVDTICVAIHLLSSRYTLTDTFTFWAGRRENMISQRYLASVSRSKPEKKGQWKVWVEEKGGQVKERDDIWDWTMGFLKPW
jgi:hypothetical protein